MTDDIPSNHLIHDVTVPAILVQDGDVTAASRAGLLHAVRIPVRIVPQSQKPGRGSNS